MIVISKYAIDNMEDQSELHENINLFKASAIPVFFGIAVFDFEGNAVILNIHASMEQPEKFNKVLMVVMAIYTLMITSFSCICYYAYGSELEDMVTLNLPHDNLTAFVQIMYCAGLLGTFPIQMIPVFEIYETSDLYALLPNPFKQ